MNSDTMYAIDSNSLADTLRIGAKLGSKLHGGEVIELMSDLGGGKTALVRGLAQGIQSRDQVMSPTFTLSRIYQGKNTDIHHFDFYRLQDPGIIAAELAESIADTEVAVAVEWSQIVEDVLPSDRLQIRITATGEDSRRLELRATGKAHQELLEQLK